MRFIPLKDGSGKYKDTQTGQVGYITRGKGGGWYLADTPNRTSLGEFKRESSRDEHYGRYAREAFKRLDGKKEPSKYETKELHKLKNKDHSVYGINRQDEKNEINPTANIEGGANTRVKRNWNRYSEEQRREEREKVLRQKIQDYKNKKNDWENTNKIYEPVLEKARPDIQEYLKDKKGFVNDEDYIKELAIETNTHIETARAIFNEEKNKKDKLINANAEEEKTPYNSKEYAKWLSKSYMAGEEYNDKTTPRYIQDIEAGRYGNMTDEDAIKNWIDGGADIVYIQDAENLLKQWGVPIKNDDAFGTYKEELTKQLLPIYKEDKLMSEIIKTQQDITQGKIEPVEKLKIENANRTSEKSLYEEVHNTYTNPRTVASYYMKKGDFAKAEEVLKDYGLEDERAEFIDSLKPSTAKEYNKYLDSINDIKIDAEDRKEFAENAINKIEAEKVAKIQKRAKTEKQKEFEMADNQMEAKIERFKERKSKVADNGIKLYTVRKNEQGTYIEDLINKYNKMVSENKGNYKTLQSLRKEIAERRKGK